MACNKLILVAALGVLLCGFMLSADARKLVNKNIQRAMTTNSMGKGHSIVATTLQKVTVLFSAPDRKGHSVSVGGILSARPKTFAERNLEMSVPSPGVGH
ncbi:hypothetical protein Sjap_026179 [Stephania japonica]|uniref:Uncharacterized protein n=1 Tax=Stephania japonica TaxID=461633 RepID=A0AAP0HET9_9MAGN